MSLDAENDLAVARTPKKIGPTGLHLVAEGNFRGIKKRFELVEVSSASVFGGKPEVGEEIAVAGFPLQVPYLVVQRGIIAATPTFPIQGTPNEREEIVLDVMVNPGNSGGPVFGVSNGSVVGVCRAHPLSRVVDVRGAALDAFQNAGLSLVTPVRYLRDLLDAQSIAYKVR